MPASPLTVRVEPDLQDHLQRFASLLGRPRSWVINRALENYLHTEEQQLAVLRDRVAAADAGEFAAPEEVESFFTQWK